MEDDSLNALGIIIGMGNLMGISTRVDERGRITIPQEVREDLGLKPDDELVVEKGERSVILRPRMGEKEFGEKLEGCISEANQMSKLSPEKLKEIWGAVHAHD